DTALGLVDKGGVVELELRHRGFEVLEVGGVDGINAAENHRLDFLEAGQRLGRGELRAGEGVADVDFAGGFDVRNDVAGVAGLEFFAGLHLRGEDADLFHFVRAV